MELFLRKEKGRKNIIFYGTFFKEGVHGVKSL
jgi:hypothetical protein